MLLPRVVSAAELVLLVLSRSSWMGRDNPTRCAPDERDVLHAGASTRLALRRGAKEIRIRTSDSRGACSAQQMNHSYSFNRAASNDERSFLSAKDAAASPGRPNGPPLRTASFGRPANATVRTDPRRAACPADHRLDVLSSFHSLRQHTSSPSLTHLEQQRYLPRLGRIAALGPSHVQTPERRLQRPKHIVSHDAGGCVCQSVWIKVAEPVAPFDGTLASSSTAPRLQQ